MTERPESGAESRATSLTSTKTTSTNCIFPSHSKKTPRIKGVRKEDSGHQKGLGCAQCLELPLKECFPISQPNTTTREGGAGGDVHQANHEPCLSTHLTSGRERRRESR